VEVARKERLMHYGIYLSSVGEFCDPNLLADLAHEAEVEGWNGAFIWDHIGHPSTAADPWVTLAAMAMRTERIKLGPIVTPVARRRPWKLARETVTVDHLSGGRLILGVGLGASRQEFEPFGEEGDPATRAEKLDEGLDVLVGLWTGEPFSYRGKHYRVDDLTFTPAPLQSPRIPIWPCGAWTEKKAPFRRAARWDGVVAIANPQQNRAISPEEVRAIKTYIKEYRVDEGPFDIAIILWSAGDGIGKEEEEAAAYAEAGSTWWLEDLSTERFSSVAEARRRLHKRPPN
jgi:alkanesulfonate monooxygenase SsuD/methylene tetrahydromethanopterin reductase-like flavin-dependent oxidoreductase (luciferase family)